MGRHIHVSNNLPPVNGESVVQEGVCIGADVITLHLIFHGKKHQE
jgi:hypothetical protein